MDIQLATLIVGFPADTDPIFRAFARLQSYPSASPINLQLEASDVGDEADYSLVSQDFDGILINGDAPNATAQIARWRYLKPQTPLVAATHRPECRAELLEAGVSEVLDRHQFSDDGLAALWQALLQSYHWQARCDTLERQRQKDEEHYRFVIEGSQEGVWDWNPIQNTLRSNDRLCEILGLSAEELPQTYEAFSQYVHPEDLAIHDLKAHFGREAPYRLELRLRHTDGSYRTCVLRAKVQHDEWGNTIRVAGVLNDISDRKRTEERINQQNRLLSLQNQELKQQREQIRRQHLAVLEASRMKSAFLATMSHELRTPLNVIIGFSQLLLRKQKASLNSLQHKTLAAIFENGKHLLSLLDDILERSKLEAGDIKLQLKRFNIVQLVTSMAANQRSLCEEKGLELRVQTNVENAIVMGDCHGMKRVISNLLSNAIKFTERGKIEVKVWETTSDRLAISISDTGIGIAPEHLKRIFATFEQLEHYNTRNYQGTGLGLAIVDALVKMMHGDIFVESELNRGSTFRIEIPRWVTNPHPTKSCHSALAVWQLS